MRKEILFAIFAGAVFGLIIAFGVWRANIALKPSTETTTTESTETPTAEFGITIAKPLDTQVLTEGTTLVSGITKPNIWVTISAEDEDYIFEADEEGSFEQEVDLVGGVNEIIIIAFDEEGTSVEEKITVVFSSEFAKQTEETEEASNQEEATEEAETVRDKVAQKVAKAKNVAFAYIGTVTDISESTLQIKNENEEIKQVSTDQETTFVKTIKTSKTVKFQDVAIGDFIIAMGFKNGNAVLEAKRVLISSPLEASNREAVFGQIVEIDKKTVTIKQTDGSQWTLEFGKSWKGPELDEIDEGNTIIAVGIASENTLETRTLFVIPEESPSPTPTPSPEPSPESEE